MRKQKQRMLSAILIALMISNCTNQTMLNAKTTKNKKVYATTNVNIRKQPNIKSKKIGLLKSGQSIQRIKKLKNGWTKVNYKGKVAYICSKYLSKNKVKYNDYPTPSNNDFKAYMSYKCISSKNSKQYKLQAQAVPKNYGIRMVEDRYCIAVGSYYTTKIGTKLDLIMKNGSIIKCILADCKANAHTDTKNMQTVHDGSIVEFIVDTSRLPIIVKRMGDISYCNNNFKGEIKNIRIYK